MSIDAVIAQARRPGNFSERRRFTIARSQAIQKLRQFALADASAYILELIQSAIGNGAVWIDIRREPRSMTLAYIGGGVPEAALTRLFDYLFAAKDRADIGPLRDLAHGINALLALEPAKIVVESGDGTREGTTRLELLRGEDRFDVGRPDHSLHGTYIRAEGLRPDDGRERSIVESSCRLAPIPIVYDSEALFGFAARRIPSLPGYRRSMVFDEGDLYGILGHDADAVRPGILLMTRGVVIEEVGQNLVAGAPLGGVINYDALHKSADHARIVRDDRMEEMWLRVRPYAIALIRGQTAQADLLDVQPWGRPRLTTVAEIRMWLHAARRVVVVGRDVAGVQALAAEQIAAALGAELLLADPAQVRALRLLAGTGVAVHTADLGTDVDLRFYTQAPATPPPRPWIAAPVDLPPRTIAALAPMFTALADDDVAVELTAALGDTAEIRARVYTPAAADDPTTTEVQLLAAGRLLYSAALPSRHAGHVLVAELPDVSPSALLAERPDGPSHAALLAAAILADADTSLAEAASRAIAGLGHRDGALGVVEVHRALEVLARTAVLQLRRRRHADGRPRPTVEFALVEPGPPGVDLLGLPLLPTHAGPPVSLRALAEAMTRHGGRVHTTPEDPSPSLRLDATAEPLVRAIVGDSALTDLRLWTGPNGHVLAAIDEHGRRYTVDQIRAAIAVGRNLAVDHAAALPPDDAPCGDDVPDELHMTPAGFLDLGDEGVASGFDFDFDEPAFIAAIPVRTAEVDGILGVPLVAPDHPAVIVLDDQRRRVHRFRELARDFGVVGVLRLRIPPWSEAQAAVVATAVAAATGQLYDRLLALLPGLAVASPAFTRAAEAMLGYAGRRVNLVADPHGRVRAAPVQATADRVLRLPLFPGRRGLPLSAWHLVHRFAEAGGDPQAVLAELDLPTVPPVLRDWLTRTLDPARIAVDAAPAPTTRSPGRRLVTADGTLTPISDVPAHTALDAAELATTLEHWLHVLRTDLPAHPRPWDRRGRVRLWPDAATDPEPHNNEFADVEGDATTWIVTLDPSHWLTRWTLTTGRRDRTAIAWLLLACFARINEHFEAVTNNHEGQFQHAVADALERGELDLVTPQFT